MIHFFVLFKLHLCNWIFYLIKNWIKVLLFKLFLILFLPHFFVIHNLVGFSQMLGSELICQATRISFFLLSFLHRFLFKSNSFFTTNLHEINPFLRQYVFSLRSLENIKLATWEPCHISLTQHISIDFEMLVRIFTDEKLNTLYKLLDLDVCSQICHLDPSFVNVKTFHEYIDKACCMEFMNSQVMIKVFSFIYAHKARNWRKFLIQKF